MKNADFSRAYDYLRQQILGGRLQPGTPLLPDLFAKKIGTSRTPVREALRQLAADGLVTNLPRVGASVRSISIDEFRNLAGLRMALEIFAAGLAAMLRSDDDLAEMISAHEGVKAELDRLIADPNFQPAPVGFQSEQLIREDVRFHTAIMTAARNELIKNEIIRHQLINRVIATANSVEIFRHRKNSLDAFVAQAKATVQEHQDILDAIVRQDVVAARDAMEKAFQEEIHFVLRGLAGAERSRPLHEFSGMTGTR